MGPASKASQCDSSFEITTLHCFCCQDQRHANSHLRRFHKQLRRLTNSAPSWAPNDPHKSHLESFGMVARPNSLSETASARAFSSLVAKKKPLLRSLVAQFLFNLFDTPLQCDDPRRESHVMQHRAAVGAPTSFLPSAMSPQGRHHAGTACHGLLLQAHVLRLLQVGLHLKFLQHSLDVGAEVSLHVVQLRLHSSDRLTS